jgi:hypothetical protein
MQLNSETIKDFKKLYFQKFGKDISDAEANEKGVMLLEFIKLIYFPQKTINQTLSINPH